MSCVYFIGRRLIVTNLFNIRPWRSAVAATNSVAPLPGEPQAVTFPYCSWIRQYSVKGYPRTKYAYKITGNYYCYALFGEWRSQRPKYPFDPVPWVSMDGTYFFVSHGIKMIKRLKKKIVVGKMTIPIDSYKSNFWTFLRS